jgi:hypothetical protein
MLEISEVMIPVDTDYESLLRESFTLILERHNTNSSDIVLDDSVLDDSDISE